ncbi:MAG: DUF3078 domain-containing protein [Cyclobacteriaceae bacterium]|nr:DUF3078 domain-containing protein [Cyclobacteriaceae bacterium]
MNSKILWAVSGIIICILLFTSHTHAQVIKVDSTSRWKKTFRTGLNINQASFTSNWKAGGVNSLGFNAFLNYKTNYKKDKNSWDNSFEFLYGAVNNQGQGARKTLDRIYVETKYGRELNTKWSYTSSLNFLSQFTKGFKYEKDLNGVENGTLISDFLAPAFITSAWGLEYHPVDYFKIRFSPFSPRLTIVADNNGRFNAVSTETPYGVPIGEDTRFEWLAFQLQAEFDKDIASNVNLKWRYVMFANYETIQLKTIDHRLDLNLVARVNKFVNVSVGGILIYDFDQDSGVQLSQAFSLGVLYSFQNFQEKK